MQYQTPEKIKLKFDAILENKEFWKDKSVCDLGCCEGMLYPLLRSRRIWDYVGIDTSVEYIELAKARYPKVKFLLQDLRTYNKAHDIYISLSTLHIFDDLEFEKIIEKFSKQCKILIFECPVVGFQHIYHVRTEEQLEKICLKYFKTFLEYGVSPSPHDPTSIRKVFKCES